MGFQCRSQASAFSLASLSERSLVGGGKRKGSKYCENTSDECLHHKTPDWISRIPKSVQAPVMQTMQ